jgi:hypothetical protein
MEPENRRERNCPARARGYITAPSIAGAGAVLPMTRRVRFAALIIAVLLPTLPANAVTQQGVQTMKKWAISDKCAQMAQRKFPDYTAEAQAKRNELMQQCLGQQNLPPRDLPVQPGPPQ